MKKFALLLALVGLGVWHAPAFAETAVAILNGTDEGSPISGKVVLTDSPEGLIVSAAVKGVPSGLHGFHIHDYGSCEEGGKAAGGHFNPDGVPHGYVLKDTVFESHPGDLGNLKVNVLGAGTLEITVPELGLSDGIYNVAGRALILHENKDDFGQPTGNAGARIACGTIVITKP